MKSIIIGITGATGIIYGIRLLESLKGIAESHLIISNQAEQNLEYETDYSVNQIKKLATFSYYNDDLSARIASGSFKTDGMIIIPCSIKTLSSVANSYSESLISRAADVSLKERRKLVLAVRETPFSFGHLVLMKNATIMGAVILPLIPAFYHKPKTIDDIINQIVGKILDQFDIEHTLYERWQGME